jgi:translation initiation factor IF-3
MSQRISAARVRLIGYEGHEIGIVTTSEARRLAATQGLALVMIDGAAEPPLCRLLDLEKYRYLMRRQRRAERRWGPRPVAKELTLSPKIDSRDLTLKVDQVRGLLDEGYKCRLLVVFEGSLALHRDRAVALLDWIAGALADVGVVEATERWAGQMAVALLAPKGMVGKIHRERALDFHVLDRPLHPIG